MRSIPSDPEKYGKALGRQLANPTVFRALDQAGLSRGERIRLRLVLDDDKTRAAFDSMGAVVAADRGRRLADRRPSARRVLALHAGAVA